MLTANGVAVLLVYGAEIKAARAGQPGVRVTAGYHDGSVLLEAVGFECATTGTAAIKTASREAVRTTTAWTATAMDAIRIAPRCRSATRRKAPP